MSAEKGKIPDSEKERRYFRVDDVIAVVANPVHVDEAKKEDLRKVLTSSRAFSLLGPPGPSETDMPQDYPEGPEDARLVDMVMEIKSKLDFIINQFILEKEDLLTTQKRLVNISASGIRFTFDHPVKVNDIMEVKLLLPAYPPIAIFAYGEVKWVKALEDNKFEMALEFINMGESVRNEVMQYILSKQRETIRRMKESGENE